MRQFMTLLLASISVIILSCNTIPEEVTELSTLRLVWNDNPCTSMSIIWDGMDSQEFAVYYDTVDYGRKYWKYAHHQSPYRKLDYYGMNTRYVKLDELEADKAYYFVVKDSAGLSAR